MIVFSRNQVIIGMQPDGTAIENYPSHEVLKYDQISWLQNGIALCIGETLPIELLQADPDALPALELHFTVTGGDGLTPPGINLDNAAQHTLSVHCEMQINGTVLPVSDKWRVPFVGKSGDLYRLLKFKNGVANFTITTDKEGLFVADVSRFATVKMGEQAYRVDVVGNASFQAYHEEGDIS